MQGGERARRSPFQKTDELMHTYYEDAKTLYECFQRGKRASSECIPSVGVVCGGGGV